MFCNGKWYAAVFMLRKLLLYIIDLETKVNSVYYCNGILSQMISE